MFFRAKNSMKLFFTLLDGSHKSKMVAWISAFPLASDMIKNSFIEFLEMENMV